MDEERKRRISLLARRSHGNRVRENVRAYYSDTLKVPAESIRFLELEKTDVMVDKVSKTLLKFSSIPSANDEHRGANYRCLWSAIHDDIECAMNGILESSADCDVYLMFGPRVGEYDAGSDCTGAIATTLYCAIDYAFTLAELDGEDLVATSLDASVYLSLEYFYDASLRSQLPMYRLRAWDARVVPFR